MSWFLFCHLDSIDVWDNFPCSNSLVPLNGLLRMAWSAKGKEVLGIFPCGRLRINPLLKKLAVGSVIHTISPQLLKETFMSMVFSCSKSEVRLIESMMGWFEMRFFSASLASSFSCLVFDLTTCLWSLFSSCASRVLYSLTWFSYSLIGFEQLCPFQGYNSI